MRRVHAQLCKWRERGSYKKKRGSWERRAKITRWPYLAWVHNASRRCKWDKGAVVMETWCSAVMACSKPDHICGMTVAKQTVLLWECERVRVREVEEGRNEDVSSSHNALHQHDLHWSDLVCPSGTSAIDRHAGKTSVYKSISRIYICILTRCATISKSIYCFVFVVVLELLSTRLTIRI